MRQQSKPLIQLQLDEENYPATSRGKSLHPGRSQQGSEAVSFTSDATLDSMVFASRAISCAAAARRAIWLRAWPTIYQDKAIVTAYPFQGDRVVGYSLEKILVETCDKKKAMPWSLKRGDKAPFQIPKFQISRHTAFLSPRIQEAIMEIGKTAILETRFHF